MISSFWSWRGSLFQSSLKAFLRWRTRLGTNLRSQKPQHSTTTIYTTLSLEPLCANILTNHPSSALSVAQCTDLSCSSFQLFSRWDLQCLSINNFVSGSITTLPSPAFVQYIRAFPWVFASISSSDEWCSRTGIKRNYIYYNWNIDKYWRNLKIRSLHLWVNLFHDGRTPKTQRLRPRLLLVWMKMRGATERFECG